MPVIQVDAESVDQLIATTIFDDHQLHLESTIEFIDDLTLRLSEGITDADAPFLDEARAELDIRVANLEAFEALYPFYDDSNTPLTDRTVMVEALQDLMVMIQSTMVNAVIDNMIEQIKDAFAV